MEQKCANCGNGKWRDGVTAITDTCLQCKYVDKEGHPQPSNWKPKTKTNADHIRAMSDEELAAWMAECNAYGERADAGQWLPWLKEPAEDQ